MTLDKILNHSVSQFPHLLKVDNNGTQITVLHKMCFRMCQYASVGVIFRSQKT